MRRVLLTCLLVALGLPSVALAVRGSSGDGTLAVRNATGDPGQPVVSMMITGAVIGQLDRGRILIDDPTPGDGPGAVVTGAVHQRDVSGTATLYSGTDIRFRAVGGKYRIRIFGSGINVNAVGQGTVRLVGSVLLSSDGRYSLNGGDWRSLPDLGDTFQLVGG
jgi:hypothetical protein